MKLLASLLLLIATLLSGPGLCAHALNGDTDRIAQQQVMDQMSDHTMMGHDMMPGEHESPGGHASHCPDGCDGGDACQGCSAITSAIMSAGQSGWYILPGRAFLWEPIVLITKSNLLDPPPPKHLS